ncbi:MAG: Foldase protein PrsA 3 [Verrucomicrobia subdivision 3 bacterium]|nr:Foldase protein PrsA 3 [Limisphaerales bacterium]MCS1414902.1 Foldase protein PrsA 3 [Limisphaerales bacterium]
MIDRYHAIRVLFLVLTLFFASMSVEPFTRGAVGDLNDFSDLFPDKVLAAGKNVQVTRNELDRAFIFIKANKASQGIPIPSSQRDKLEAQLLDKLITTKIILGRATKTELVAGDAFVKQELDALRERLGSEESMQRHIVASGVSEDYFRQQLYERGVVKAVLQREVKGNYLVPKSEIRQYYQQNQQAFTEPESVNIRCIFISRVFPGSGAVLPEKALKEREALMEDIRRRALAGEDFAKLATDYSEDPLTRHKGGQTVIFKGQTKPEFEVPVFGLPDGGISEIMTIGAGLHLVKILEHRLAKLRPLKEVEAFIRTNLEAKFIEKKLPKYLEDLKKGAGVKFMTEE